MESMLKLREFCKSIIKESKKKKDQEEVERWQRLYELNENVIKSYKGGK